MIPMENVNDFYRGQQVLVTGGAGFIGSHLTTRLAHLGAQVRVLDDLSGGHVENLDAVAAQIAFRKASILDADVLDAMLEDCSIVFHEAALASVPASIEEPMRYHEVNITGTALLLQRAVRAGVRRVVFASSSSVYGDQPVLPKEETQPPDPLSPYAMQKLAGEHLCRVWSLCYGISTVCLRYFNIFGPWQRADSAYAAVVAAFAKALLAGQRPKIFGDGQASRDFTYVDDVVQANLRAGCVAWDAQRPEDHPATCGGLINIARGGRVTVLELARMMAEIAKHECDPVFNEPRPGDVLHSLADISRARDWLGYEPTVAVHDGLGRTLEWYRSLLAAAS